MRCSGSGDSASGRAALRFASLARRAPRSVADFPGFPDGRCRLGFHQSDDAQQFGCLPSAIALPFAGHFGFVLFVFFFYFVVVVVVVDVAQSVRRRQWHVERGCHHHHQWRNGRRTSRGGSIGKWQSCQQQQRLVASTSQDGRRSRSERIEPK